MFVITRHEAGKIKDMALSDDKVVIDFLEYEWMIELTMGAEYDEDFRNLTIKEQWDNLHSWYEDISKDQSFGEHIERFEVEHFHDHRTLANVVSSSNFEYTDPESKIVDSLIEVTIPTDDGFGIVQGWETKVILYPDEVQMPDNHEEDNE